ncbi:MAG: multiheme c-type cytochrome [Rubripirellula sp.]
MRPNRGRWGCCHFLLVWALLVGCGKSTNRESADRTIDAALEDPRTSSPAGETSSASPSSASPSSASPSSASPSSVGQSDTGNATSTVRASFEELEQFPTGYVGTKVCAECHVGRHGSYLNTHHSRSLRPAIAASEPQVQNDELNHVPSRRSYDVATRAGQLWHRELRQTGGPNTDKFVVNELPVCYVMGSGAFAKGYLLADKDYLLQSPVTWYSNGDTYGMAPGYDHANQIGLTRMVNDECLYCHAGLVSQRDGNPRQPLLHELAIGCERCHGPGQAHTDLYRQIEAGDLKPVATDSDPLIVNPSKLPRAEAESICSQCHLHGDIVVQAPGTQVWDFVPGEDFANNRLHYKEDAAGAFSKVFTGHFDQMWQSSCYLESETLTCMTCHDSHHEGVVEDRVAMRREQCNECHQTNQSCGLPLKVRLSDADNDCVQCHMPSLGSEIPHASTTSHLIAIYEDGRPRGLETIDQSSLRRVESANGVQKEQLALSDLLAETYWSLGQALKGDMGPLQSRPLEQLLEERLERGDAPAEIHSLLARLNRDLAESPSNRDDQQKVAGRWKAAETHARETLALESRPSKIREAALETLGNQSMEAGNYREGIRCFAELSQTRRSAVDWYNLGLCLARESRLKDAEQALREAIRIDGNYVPPYRSLAVLYRSVDPRVSQQLEAMANRLSQE